MNGRAEEGLRIFEEMRRTNVEGNYVLFSSVLNACVNIPALEQDARNVVSWGALIAGHVQNG